LGLWRQVAVSNIASQNRFHAFVERRSRHRDVIMSCCQVPHPKFPRSVAAIDLPNRCRTAMPLFTGSPEPRKTMSYNRSRSPMWRDLPSI
jgi:hypothetical protein